jgi:hypothetical protein
MILEEMYQQYDLLKAFKDELTNNGHGYKQLAWINGQLDILNKLIRQESYDVLDELLRKTNFRLLKSINKGMHNLLYIYANPYEWQLAEFEGNNQEWFSDDSLIFSTERQQLVFSRNVNGYKYVNNKWQ